MPSACDTYRAIQGDNGTPIGTHCIVRSTERRRERNRNTKRNAL